MFDVFEMDFVDRFNIIVITDQSRILCCPYGK